MDFRVSWMIGGDKLLVCFSVTNVYRNDLLNIIM